MSKEVSEDSVPLTLESLRSTLQYAENALSVEPVRVIVSTKKDKYLAERLLDVHHSDDDWDLFRCIGVGMSKIVKDGSWYVEGENGEVVNPVDFSNIPLTLANLTALASRMMSEGKPPFCLMVPKGFVGDNGDKLTILRLQSFDDPD